MALFWMLVSLSVISTSQGTTAKTCSDVKVYCPRSQTCCSFYQDLYGCCPYSSAICCSDKRHCCPNGYTCSDTTPQQCIRNHTTHAIHINNNNIISTEPQPIQGTAIISRIAFLAKNSHNNNNVGGSLTKTPIKTSKSSSSTGVTILDVNESKVCPNQNTTCQTSETCCSTTNGYGCCPFANAVCCSDKIHCCPMNTLCDAQGYCHTSSPSLTSGLTSGDAGNKNQIDTSERKNRQKNKYSSKKQLCPDGKSKCLDNWTCCQVANGDWACCPLKEAICCPDKIHCCPTSSKCGKGGCDKNGIKTPLHRKMPAF